jgi:hypothetical protein
MLQPCQSNIKIQTDSLALHISFLHFQGMLLAADKLARFPVRLGTSGFGVAPKLTGWNSGFPVF